MSEVLGLHDVGGPSIEVGPSTSDEIRSFDCCGVRIDAASMDEAVAALCRPAGSDGPGRAVHLCNAYTLSLASSDANYAGQLNAGTFNFPDGMPLIWIARRLGLPLSGRVYGPDLMRATIDAGRTFGLRHYLYGTTPETLAALTGVLHRTYPGVEIVGTDAPPFRALDRREEDAVVERIRAASPDIVWVGLGTPRQDEFVYRFRTSTPSTLVAVGAAFDFIAGDKAQAPSWVQDRGLEWAYRLVKEPRRLWRRYLVGNTKFVAGAIRGTVVRSNIDP